MSQEPAGGGKFNCTVSIQSTFAGSQPLPGRRQEIGFAADMCLLGAPGGARDMLARGYRCILLRDATVGVETPQSFPERLSTRYAVHLFEWKVGFGMETEELVEALEGTAS